MHFLSRLLHPTPYVEPVVPPDDSELFETLNKAKEANVTAAAGLASAMHKQTKDAKMIRQVLSGVLQRVEAREVDHGKS